MPPEMGGGVEKSAQLVQSEENVDLWKKMSKATSNSSKRLFKGKSIAIECWKGLDLGTTVLLHYKTLLRSRCCIVIPVLILLYSCGFNTCSSVPI